MRVCIIVPESPYLFDPWTIEPLGALYLAGAAKPVADEVLVRVWNQEPVPQADWYGISVVTPHYEQVRSIIKELRIAYPQSQIVLGGAHCTFLPMETVHDLQPDFLVAGEGEIAFRDILTNRWWTTPGVYTRASAILSSVARHPVLPSLPIPDHSLLLHDYYPNPAFAKEPGGAIMASRGCPFGCSYCGKSIGGAARWRKPEQVAEEMELYNQWRFEDDDIFGNRKWFRTFAKLVPPNKEWRCSVRASSVTPEILDLALGSGCRQAGVGVETCSPELLKIHCPSKTVETNTKAVKMIKESGMQVTAFLIAGLPGETEETIQDTIDWIEEVRPDKFTVSACTPYPGSPIYANPKKYGITRLDTEFENFRQLGREDDDVAFVFDTEQADRRELTRLWKKLRRVARYGIAKDERK
jgi:radical SAM superfamily enzyme YgiQ (UPF0313 family)